MRLTLALILSCSLCAVALADDPAKQLEDSPIPARILTLTPQPIETPELRYPLLPPYLERTDGNAATLYYRSLVSLSEILHTDSGAKSLDDIIQWMETPPDKLPRDDVREKLKVFKTALGGVELGAAKKLRLGSANL